MRRSERARLIEKCEKIIREQKYRLFGKRCQFCGRTTGLGLFHILAKSTHPKIRLHEDNLLIACWFPCHHSFHHDPYYARDVVFPKIKELCGDDYEERLLEIERSSPKLSLVRLKELHEELRKLNE